MKETKLTSVKIIDDLYKNFKSKVVQNGFNLLVQFIYIIKMRRLKLRYTKNNH